MRFFLKTETQRDSERLAVKAEFFRVKQKCRQAIDEMHSKGAGFEGRSLGEWVSVLFLLAMLTISCSANQDESSDHDTKYGRDFVPATGGFSSTDRQSTFTIPISIRDSERFSLISGVTAFQLSLESCLSGYSATVTEANDGGIEAYKDDSCTAKLTQFTYQGLDYFMTTTDPFVNWQEGETAIFDETGEPGNNEVEVYIDSTISDPLAETDVIMFRIDPIAVGGDEYFDIPRADVKEHVIFVTSSTYQGDFGSADAGLAAADALCQTEAGSLKNDVTWKAIASTHATDAKNRIVQSWGDFKNNNGEVVANSVSDLFDGNLAASINYDVSGSAIVSNTMIWTGSNSDGTADTSNHCLNWSDKTNANSARYGDVTALTGTWFDAGSQTCDSQARIACVAQITISDLDAFTVTTHATNLGSIDIDIDFPSDTTHYDSVDVRRVSGITAPSSSCGDGSDTVIASGITDFSTNWRYEDSGLSQGHVYSYRVCVYDIHGNVVTAAIVENIQAKGL